MHVVQFFNSCLDKVNVQHCNLVLRSNNLGWSHVFLESSAFVAERRKVITIIGNTCAYHAVSCIREVAVWEHRRSPHLARVAATGAHPQRTFQTMRSNFSVFFHNIGRSHVVRCSVSNSFISSRNVIMIKLVYFFKKRNHDQTCLFLQET